MFKLFLCILIVCFIHIIGKLYLFKGTFSAYDVKYGDFSEEERLKTLQDVREMFYFGYDNYMKHAYPLDELNPIYCSGRGPDYENPSNLNVNDVLGDYILTLVDTLDTLAVMGNTSEFKRAVQLVIDNISFDKPSTVQVFEATIRVIGGLLSAHLIITDPDQPFGDITPPDYSDQLLYLSNDLASRLIPAFQNTATGLPYPRVNLRDGVLPDCINETCTSGAGSLVLEFSILSRLLHDPTYESLARRSVRTLWKYRSNVTGLLGNVINIQTGDWVGQMSGLGAGLDSFYEYLLKSYILFGDPEDLKMFNDSYETIRYNMRRGRLKCDKGVGFPPIYVNVHMKTGDTANNWIDALQAAWSGVQVLAGDIDEAVCSHAFYYSIWRKYQSLPERYNWNTHTPDVLFYPLRPELVESTYLLYQATRNPFYLHVGRDIYDSINNHARAQCGYGTIHDVNTKELEDRMESFFLSETCKYLYLLFDRDNHLNRKAANYIFSTEGHIFPLNQGLRRRPWEGDVPVDQAHHSQLLRSLQNSSVSNCESVPKKQRYFLPLDGQYMEQIDVVTGAEPIY